MHTLTRSVLEACKSLLSGCSTSHACYCRLDDSDATSLKAGVEASDAMMYWALELDSSLAGNVLADSVRATRASICADLFESQ